MPICKFCGIPFDWGQRADGKYVPLVPSADDADLPRTYVDEDGVLRAEHLLVCDRGKGSVRIDRLAEPIIPGKE